MKKYLIIALTALAITACDNKKAGNTDSSTDSTTISATQNAENEEGEIESLDDDEYTYFKYQGTYTLTNKHFLKGFEGEVAIYHPWEDKENNGIIVAYNKPEVHVGAGDGAKFDIKIFFNQVGMCGRVYYEKTGEDLNLCGLTKDAEMNLIDDENADKIEYLVAVTDLNADGYDEVIIAGRSLYEDDMNYCGVSVYSSKTKQCHSVGTSDMILGDAFIELSNTSTFTAERHLRGFFYQWTWSENGFTDESDI